MRPKKTVFSLLIAIMASLSAYPATYSSSATIHCAEPGQLKLSHEAKMAVRLTVTGDINAIDFATLKAVTINTTQELDLSQATIHAYKGTQGCYAALTSDWFITDPESVEYPANTLPIDAFTEVRDNSLSKRRQGSESLRKLILPKNLSGVMRRAFDNAKCLTEVVVPAENKALVCESGALLTYSKDKLLMLVPGYNAELQLPATLTSIAEGVFDNVSPVALIFNGNNNVTFGKDNTNLKTAYIQAPNPDYYKNLYPEIDCTEPFDYITVENISENALANELGNRGYKRADLRALKISGSISENDFKWLMELPALHKLDLSHAEISSSGRLTISGTTLTDIVMPSSFNSYAQLHIYSPFLKGSLEVSEGTWYVDCNGTRLDKISFPASLTDLSQDSFRYSNIKEADFSKCKSLKVIDAFYGCMMLRKLLLPSNLEKLRNVTAPLEEIVLPESLKIVEYCGNWEIGTLRVPSNLTKLNLWRLPNLTALDASEARLLVEISGFHHTPLLKEVDLSQSPIRTLSMFDGDSHFYEKAETSRSKAPVSRLVITGGPLHPALNLCGIETVKLPSTVKSISGFNYCDNLANLNLEPLYKLSELSICQKCPALKSVALPCGITNFNQSFSGCPAIENVRISALTPPVIGKSVFDGDMSGISLTVPTNTSGSYRMAEVWENCKSITNGGFVLNFHDSLYGYTENLSGSGMYEPGTTVTLSAGTVPGALNSEIGKLYKPVNWLIDEIGWCFESNPTFTMPSSHIYASANYETDFEEADIELSITALEQTVCRLSTYSNSTDFYVYLDGLTAYLGTPTSNRYGNWNLTQGTHDVRIYGDLTSLSVGLDTDYNIQPGFIINSVDMAANSRLGDLSLTRLETETFDLSESETLTGLSLYESNVGSVILNNCKELSSLYITSNSTVKDVDIQGCSGLRWASFYGHLDNLNLDGCSAIENLSIHEYGNTELNVSQLTNLTDLYLSGNIRKLTIGEKPALKYVNVSGCELCSLDLSGCPALEHTDIGYTRLPVNADNDYLFDLKSLQDYGLDISRIENISVPLQDTFIRFTDPFSGYYIPEVSYNYACGNNAILHVVLYNNTDLSSIDEILSDRGSVRVDGRDVIVTGTSGVVSIFDTTGREVARTHQDNTDEVRISLKYPGIYLVKTPAEVKKIIIR